MKLPPISKEALDSLDPAAFDALAKQSHDIQSFISLREHYRLLAYLSVSLPPAITHPFVDIGTHFGDSALALSRSGGPVVTFDVERRANADRLGQLGINYVLADLWNTDVREQWADVLLSAPLIFLDIDPHEGTREYSFVKWLQANKFKGLLLLDDINYFQGMRELCWNRIEPEYKRDWTSLGHWTGTGAVSFTGFES